MILLWVQTVENDVINKMPLFNNKVGAISIDDIVFIFKRFTFYIIFTTWFIVQELIKIDTSWPQEEDNVLYKPDK